MNTLFIKSNKNYIIFISFYVCINITSWWFSFVAKSRPVWTSLHTQILCRETFFLVRATTPFRVSSIKIWIANRPPYFFVFQFWNASRISLFTCNSSACIHVWKIRYVNGKEDIYDSCDLFLRHSCPCPTFCR